MKGGHLVWRIAQTTDGQPDIRQIRDVFQQMIDQGMLISEKPCKYVLAEEI